MGSSMISSGGSTSWAAGSVAEQGAVARSLLSLLRETVQRDPAALLVIDADEAEPRFTTRGELWRRVELLRDDLAGRGVRRGDCLAVWLPNWSDCLVWQFAAVALGAHVIGINTRYNVDEVAHLLERARPVVLAIAHGFIGLDLGALLHRVVAAAQADAPAVAVVGGAHGAAVDAATLGRYDVGRGAWAPTEPAAGSSAASAPMEDFPDELAVAFTTSGSTGRPKLAAHSSRAVAEHAYASAAAGGWKQGDVTLCVLPLSGVFAFIPAMATIASGGTCLLEPVFQPDRILAGMQRFGVTHVAAADDVIGRLADAYKAAPQALPRWRRLLIADFNGKSLELAEWAEGEFGLKASGVYGSSELFALTSVWPEQVPAPRRWRGGGVPVSPRIEVRCVDPETGSLCDVGSSGELQFKGPNVVDAYLGGPELRALSSTADGWFRSGDLGVVNTDGSFDYICRAGDSLRLRGFLVEPAEIEQRLAAHAAVDIAKVVGLKLPDGQTEAVAFVVLRHGAHATGEELRAWCAAGLARHKVPRDVHVIDTMPVTSGVNGTKIRSAELRRWAQEREAARAGRS